MIYAVGRQKARIKKALRSGKRPPERRRRCWEVYVGEGKVSAYLTRLGADVRTFGLDDGWDLTSPTHQTEFLRMMDDEEPDDIWLSPMCGPWSIAQNFNALTEESVERLKL